MYKIVFIDESEEDGDDFLDYIDSCNNADLISAKVLPPSPEIDELVETIFDMNVDAVIVDFELNEMRVLIDYNVPYNGVEVVEAVLNQRDGFPCFVMTSFDDDAIKASNDVNVIYQKDILHGKVLKGEQKASFMDRVIHQIEHYRARIKNAEKEFNNLITKSREGQLNAMEESTLKDLDGFLERSAYKHAAIPDSIKEKSMKADIHKLIENTDKLLEALGD